ncbi:hypothetical protein JNUCC0626_48520 [Lentzea sp. JNUCC 0626]|uniref:hypothetical protein n=1 Tax=Lentzea sp. JNUCC 0626 TaxID=3367513 RepID=UPI0037478666
MTAGTSYYYHRIVHLGSYTLRAQVHRDITPYNSYGTAELLSADLTWTNLKWTHGERWTKDTPQPCDVTDAKAVLTNVADELIRRATAILHNGTAVPQQSLDLMGALLTLAYGSTGEHAITAADVRWAKENGGPFRVVPKPDGTVLLTKAHRYDCPLLATQGAEACDDRCLPTNPPPSRSDWSSQ